MLPQYVGLKTDLEKLLFDMFKDAARQQLKTFEESPRFIQHEGTTHEYNTLDGNKETMDFHEIGVEVLVTRSELPSMSFQQVIDLMIDKGMEFGAKQAQFHFAKIHQITTSTGNVVAGPLTIENILEALEGLHISFDDHGNARMPSIVIHPSLTRRFTELARDAESDVSVNSRVNEIFAQKKAAWDEEQSSRKLVD